MLRRFLILSGTVGFVIFTSLAAHAGKDDSGRRFWGLWEAVDSLDGSTEQVSMSKGEDGSLDLLWRESYWTICDGRRGILRGSGRVERSGRRAVVFEMQITCFDPEEVVLEDSIRFELVGQNMLLASSPGAFTDLPFFRVSGRVLGSGRDDD